MYFRHEEEGTGDKTGKCDTGGGSIFDVRRDNAKHSVAGKIWLHVRVQSSPCCCQHLMPNCCKLTLLEGQQMATKTRTDFSCFHRKMEEPLRSTSRFSAENAKLPWSLGKSFWREIQMVGFSTDKGQTAFVSQKKF